MWYLTRDGCFPQVKRCRLAIEMFPADHRPIDFDPRLRVPFSCQIVGPSGCGKTFFVKSVLENCQDVLSQVPENIVWIYTSFQPMYDELQKMNKKIKFVEGLPDSFFRASRSSQDFYTIQTPQEHERHDVDTKCFSSGQTQSDHQLKQ